MFTHPLILSGCVILAPKIVEIFGSIYIYIYTTKYSYDFGCQYIYIYIYIQGVSGGMFQTSGGCSLC